MPRRIDTQAVIDAVRLEEQASDISTPASGYGAVFAKTDGKPYYINDAGTVTDLSGGGSPSVVEGRLTLTTGTPVTTADVTAATTLYFAPYKGNRIGIFDGTSWSVEEFSELSLSLSGYTADSNYDIFVYDNSGTLTLESTIWTNGTTRATALTTQDGIYVKTGATTRRYLGTIRITSTTGQTEDSEAKRYVWNYYNRSDRGLAVTDATSFWTYATVAWRPANNSTGNRVEAVIGVAEDYVSLVCLGEMSAAAGSCQGTVGIGVDATTSDSSTLGMRGQVNAASYNISLHAMYNGSPGIGYHYFQWIEFCGNAASTVTFYGSGGSMPHGLNGFVRG